MCLKSKNGTRTGNRFSFLSKTEIVSRESNILRGYNQFGKVYQISDDIKLLPPPHSRSRCNTYKKNERNRYAETPTLQYLYKAFI